MDIIKIRQEFPILGDGLIYLDSAATAQKPESVLGAMDTYYREANANVHRGMHGLAEKATVAYETARKTVADFIGAKSHEVIFTKNCTEAINLVSRCWGVNFRPGDSVVLSIMEHHSNVIPWLQLKEWIGIDIGWTDINDDGSLKTEELDALLAKGNVRLVSITGLSNVLGTGPNLKEVIAKAHDAGAKVLIDAAQLIVHERIDVRDLDADFVVFSGHKLYGPTGIGVLYAKRELLEAMPPFLGGGMMIDKVTTDDYTCADIPAKFEAGTPPIAEAVGLKAAIDWLTQFDAMEVKAHEDMLIRSALDALNTVGGLRILGAPKTGCISFVIEGIHPHDLTDIIGKNGICMRAGHHCTQPLHTRLGVNASTRLSVGIYTTEHDIASVPGAIEKARKLL